MLTTAKEAVETRRTLRAASQRITSGGGRLIPLLYDKDMNYEDLMKVKKERLAEAITMAKDGTINNPRNSKHKILLDTYLREGGELDLHAFTKEGSDSQRAMKVATMSDVIEGSGRSNPDVNAIGKGAVAVSVILTLVEIAENELLNSEDEAKRRAGRGRLAGGAAGGFLLPAFMTALMLAGGITPLGLIVFGVAFGILGTKVGEKVGEELVRP